MSAGACFYFVLTGWMPWIKQLPSGRPSNPIANPSRLSRADWTGPHRKPS